MSANSFSQIQLLQPLSSLGAVTELDFEIDPNAFEQQIGSLLGDWRRYNPRKDIVRYGMSLTSLDGSGEGVPDLDSLKEYNSINGTDFKESQFREPTLAYRKLTSLHSLFNYYREELGRSHLIRLDRGGHFPPHRDAYIEPSCFRIFVPCSNCARDQFVFLIGNQRVELTPWKAYFIDTRLEHTVFSFADGSIQLVMNVMLNEQAIQKTLQKLKIR